LLNEISRNSLKNFFLALHLSNRVSLYLNQCLMYTWVATHKAIAEKLLAYQQRQQELIDLLKDAGETILTDIDSDGQAIPLKEIDPFTFFCYIYKYGPENSLKKLKHVAKVFNIQPLPEDTNGIPSANAQKVWLFPFKKERGSNDIERLWTFFKAVLNQRVTDELFADAISIKNTGKTKITEGMFYVFPERFLPVNAQTRPYLNEVLNIDPDFKNYTEYDRVLQRVKNKTSEPFYKISHQAWVWNTSTSNSISVQAPAISDVASIEREHQDFPIHEISFIRSLSEIGEQRAINLFFEKADLLIERAKVDPNKIHTGIREDNRMQITIARRYALKLRKKSNNLEWGFILDSNDLEQATAASDFDYSDYFSDKDGSQKYAFAQFVVKPKKIQPVNNDLWVFWLNAAANYYNETKETRLVESFRKHTNLAFLKALFDKDYRRHVIDRSIAFGSYPSQKKLVERYKALMKASEIYGEEYKWDILGKNYWDIEADDMTEMVKKIPFKNLVYPLAVGVLKQLASNYPDELKEGLKTLFYSNEDLVDRIRIFRNLVDSLYKKIDHTLSSHHDERTVAAYLAFFNPDKYPLYKSSFYVGYCKLLNRKPAVASEKYQDYINLVDDLIGKYIKPDKDLLQIYDNVRGKDRFEDKNYYLLAQDLLFRLLDGKGDFIEKKESDYKTKSETPISTFADLEMKPLEIEETEDEEPQGQQQFWWLNANVEIWSINDCKKGDRETYTARNEKGNKRRIYKHFQSVRKGDYLIGYETSPVKQIRAIFEISRGLHPRPEEGEVIEIELIEKLEVPVGWNELQNNPALKNCEVFVNNQGSLFMLTEEEFDVIREVIDNKNIGVLENTAIAEYDYENDPEKPFIPVGAFKQILEVLKRKKNIILQGPPGVGKTFVARKIAYEMMGVKNDANIEMVQFHQSFSYEDFIQGLRPGKENFELKNGVFYTFCQKAHTHPDRQFFFIIDEINRGNLSKIFGELMMLVEPDKRKEKFALKLTYSEDEYDRFYIPENLYIIGTMNTADRSLAIVDYALRRRFAFINIEPDFGPAFQNFVKIKGLSKDLTEYICNSMSKINSEIQKDVNLGSGFKIGHSYFCSYSVTMAERDWYNEVITFEIKPLLEEIWFDDLEKVKRLVNEISQ